MLRKYYAVFGPALRVMDGVVLVGCWFLAYYLRKHYPLSIMTNAIPPFDEYAAYGILIVFLWGSVFSIFNLYSSQRMVRRTVEAYRVLRAHTLSCLIFISLTYLVSTYKLSRGVFVYFYFIAGFLLVFGRLQLRNTLRRLRSRGYNQYSVLLVGNGEAAKQTLTKLLRHPELGLRIVGHLAPKGAPSPGENTPWLGEYSELAAVAKSHAIDKVVIALPRSEMPQLEVILASIKDEMLDIALVPDIYDYIAIGCEVEDFDGLPMVSLNETPMMGFNLLLKRFSDIVLAMVAIIVTLPLMFLLAILVGVTSRGPVFYRQERMSLNGKKFSMLKFRSMTVDQAGDVELLTRKDDPRVTSVGRFMRKTSLDELPQFFNVLVGDMSIVGPRPERTWVVDKVRSQIPRYMLKHKVKAGITGWAQVNGWRGDTSLEKRVEYDLYYIRNWSLLFDLKILFLTVFRGLISRNAY